MKRKAIGLLLFCLLLSSCFKKSQPNENALLHQRACVLSIESNDFTRAKIHCELCLEFDAAMPECLNGYGLIALMEKDEEKARIFFTKALRQNNDFSQARSNMGVIYFSHGDFVTALKYFDRALEIDPANTDARYNSGLSHFRLGQRVRAMGNAKKSIEHFLMAKDQLQKVLALESGYDSALRDLGLIDLNLYALLDLEAPRQELLVSAKTAFSDCLKANHEEDSCFEGLAHVYFEEGKYDQSVANYFLCLAFAPNNSSCRSNIAIAYEKSAQAENGYKKFTQTVKDDPRNAQAHEAFCAALFERGLDQEGLKECELALRIKPGLCSAQFRLGEYFASIFNGERASKHCQAFLSCGTKGDEREIKKCQNILATMKRS